MNAESKYELNYIVINKISTLLNICQSFIDLFNWESYKGNRYIHHGRIIIQLPPRQQSNCSYIIIDKDHKTRYFVENVVSFVDKQTQNSKFQRRDILAFWGYKMELDKYMIHGYFQLFQMKTYNEYFGFDFLDLQFEEYKFLKAKKINKLNDKGILLFCKINREKESIKYYFDKELNPIKWIVNQQDNRKVIPDHFSCTMHDCTLKKIYNGQYLNTKVLNYFFERLVFSYYSQFWYKNKPQRHIKIFESQRLSFFYNQHFDYSYFHQKLFNLYAKIGKNSLQEQELILFPIFEYGKDHFVLGVIKVDNKSKVISLYELDPLDSKQGTWRNRLELIILQNKDFLQKMKILGSFNYQIRYFPSILSVPVPKQRSSADCGAFVCLYTLLIMQKFQLIELDEELKKMCRSKETTQQVILFMRKFIYRSYTQRNTHLLSSFQENFRSSFENSKIL